MVTTVVKISETETTDSITVAPGIEVLRVKTLRCNEGQETTQVKELIRLADKPTEENFGSFHIVEPELLENLRMNGWFSDGDYDLISKNPFTRVLNGKPYALVRIKSYDHSLYDHENNRLPVAVRLGYIDGRVNNYHFDLRKLLTHLQFRADVTLHRERWSNSYIQSVPSSNRGDLCGTEFIEFTWHPDVETFREYCARSSKVDYFGRHRVIHTMIGNDAFRKPNPDEEL